MKKSVSTRTPFYLWMACVWMAAVGLFSCTSHKPLHEINMAYLYDRQYPLQLQHRILSSGDQVQVFLQIAFRKMEGLQNHLSIWDKYKVRYEIRSQYETASVLLSDSLGPADRVFPSINPLVLQIRLPALESNRVLSVHIKERYSSEETVFDVPLQPKSQSGIYHAALFRSNGRIPVFEPYIQSGDTVVLRTMEYLEEDSSLLFYPPARTVALPPMAAIPVSGNDFEKPFPVRVKFNERVLFREPGYYFVPTKDGNTGFGFCVVPAFYPQVSLPLELIDPMVYISTRDERKTLLTSSTPKLALDQFWLAANSNKDQARKLIRNYFENIEDANRYFTSHKDGWRTDRGMVLAIYGRPTYVYRTWDAETWQYDKAVHGENTVFYFTRRPDPRSPMVWELKRYNEYDRVWYGVVELWRKGVLSR
jgi:GWxTD domain-containing protein